MLRTSSVICCLIWRNNGRDLKVQHLPCEKVLSRKTEVIYVETVKTYGKSRRTVPRIFELGTGWS